MAGKCDCDRGRVLSSNKRKAFDTLFSTMAEANLWDVSPRMGLAEKTTEARKTAKYWIQKYLSSESNTNYPSDINKLTYEYLEEENMQIFI